MANHASAKKRARQTIKRTLRNRQVKTTARTYTKRFRAAVEESNLEDAKTLLAQVVSILDKAVTKGVYHRKTASRYISRLTTHLNSLRQSS